MYFLLSLFSFDNAEMMYTIIKTNAYCFRFILLFCNNELIIGLGHSLTSEDQDRLKCQLKNASYGYIYSYDYSKQKRILTKEEWMALNDLRKDSSVIITKPDRGNGVVILNRQDYLNEMKQLILRWNKI